MNTLSSNERCENVTRNYKLYKHTSPSGKVYYGITSQEPLERWQNGRGYIDNKYFWRAIQKYGWNAFAHEIIADNLTKEEAAILEIEYIALSNATDHRYGYNKSPGGWIQAPISDDTRSKMSKNHADFRFGKSSKSKPVYQYSRDGVFVQEYESVSKASSMTGISSDCIAGVARGKHFSAGGFRWSYVKEEILADDVPLHGLSIRAYRYSLDGKYLDSLGRLKDAAQLYNAFLGGMKENEIRQSGGYLWSIVYHDSVPSYKNRRASNLS